MQSSRALLLPDEGAGSALGFLMIFCARAAVILGIVFAFALAVSPPTHV
jgi:hypothetical protein